MYALLFPTKSLPSEPATWETSTKYFFHFCLSTGSISQCVKSRGCNQKITELYRSLRSRTRDRCLRFRIVQFFLPLFVQSLLVWWWIFRSNLWHRMLFLYGGIKMKAFAFLSVFRRRNRRRTRWFWFVCTSTVRVRSFVHSSSLRSANIRQHDTGFCLRVSINVDSRWKS